MSFFMTELTYAVEKALHLQKPVNSKAKQQKAKQIVKRPLRQHIQQRTTNGESENVCAKTGSRQAPLHHIAKPI